ncbi:MAG: hypothetical protein D6690_14830 [Nitrospirae bacterium]|nr:MAG: hypothetical protein D6690_14830 [Nitrospirota bacterium]
MIRINLLPVQRSVCDGRRSPVVLGAGIVSMLVIVLACWWWQATIKAHYQKLIQERDKKLVALRSIEQRTTALESVQQHYDRLRQDKDALIGLRRSNGNPVMFLDVVSREMEDLDLWLDRLTLHASTVEIEGRALDEESVRRFLDRLERSPAVEHLETFTMMPIRYSETRVYQFILHLGIA